MTQTLEMAMKTAKKHGHTPEPRPNHKEILVCQGCTAMATQIKPEEPYGGPMLREPCSAPDYFYAEDGAYQKKRNQKTKKK